MSDETRTVTDRLYCFVHGAEPDDHSCQWNQPEPPIAPEAERELRAWVDWQFAYHTNEDEGPPHPTHVRASAGIWASLLAEIDRLRVALRGTAAQADGGEAPWVDQLSGEHAPHRGNHDGYACGFSGPHCWECFEPWPCRTERGVTTGPGRVAQADTAPGGGLDAERLARAMARIAELGPPAHLNPDDAEEHWRSYLTEATDYSAEYVRLTPAAAAAPPDPTRLARAMERVPADEFELARLTDSETLAESIVKHWDGAARQAGGGS